MSKNHDSRVLSRMGARELNEKENNLIHGPGTETVCTFEPGYGPDGDFSIGEC